MMIRQIIAPNSLMLALERRAPHLRYTNPSTIYQYVDADYGKVYVGVFGDGDNAAYEWFIWDEDANTLRTSDCGYCCIGVALTSGLVEAGAQRSNGDHDLVLTWVRKGTVA